MKKSNIYLGLDVHKQFIQVAVRCPDGREVTGWRVPNTPAKVKGMISKVRKFGVERIEACYEAGPTGYCLARQLNGMKGVSCMVIAPSLIPTKAGDRVKTDRRDAKKLAEYLEAGLLTEVKPPTSDDEARRELCRARGSAKDEEKKAKQRLSKFLLRHDRRFTAGKKLWTNIHLAWLEHEKFEHPHLQMAFDSLLRALTQATDRVRELDDAIEAASQDEAVREPVAWLRCFKGIDTTTAMGVVSELYSFERFASPRELMGFLGQTPRESSTGGNPKRGAITKAGNGRVRKLLTEAAWNYTRSNKSGYKVRSRRQDQPGWVVDQAEKAQHRLHTRYWRLVNRGKHKNLAVAAIARELSGFIWVVLAAHAHGRQEAHA